MTALYCIALAAHMEARQHFRDPDALAAVAAVIINRAEDPRYAPTPCEVIAAPNQFPWYRDDLEPPIDGAWDEWAWDVAQDVAQAALDGEGLQITATHFRTAGAPQYWETAEGYRRDGRIGGNVFFTNEGPYK